MSSDGLTTDQQSNSSASPDSVKNPFNSIVDEKNSSTNSPESSNSNSDAGLIAISDRPASYFLTSPARIQVNPNPQKSSNEFEYHSNRTGNGLKSIIVTRCRIPLDCGWTRGSLSSESRICLYFSQGKCPHGENCVFLHRIPVSADRLSHSSQVEDCFGRSRFASLKSDCSGVGSFEGDGRCLYVGQLVLGNSNENTGSTVESGKNRRSESIRYSEFISLLSREFGEYGKLSSIRLLPDKNCAFIEYSDRSNAEFAREAMMNRSIGNTRFINVRWALEDPNPATKKRKLEENLSILEDAMTNKLSKITPSVNQQLLNDAFANEFAILDQLAQED